MRRNAKYKTIETYIRDRIQSGELNPGDRIETEKQLGEKFNIDPVSAAMNGGEDFQLLIAVPILQAEKFRRDFQTFDVIGHLALSEAGTVLVAPGGAELPLRAQGWPEESI